MRSKELSLGLILTLAVSGCSERSSSFYDDYSELGKSDLMDRGWIPAWVHSDAQKITEKHDLDTNKVVITYNSFSAKELGAPEFCEEANLPNHMVEILGQKIDASKALSCGAFFISIKEEIVTIWKLSS